MLLFLQPPPPPSSSPPPLSAAVPVDADVSVQPDRPLEKMPEDKEVVTPQQDNLVKPLSPQYEQVIVTLFA